jgi:hypothetical protein
MDGWARDGDEMSVVRIDSRDVLRCGGGVKRFVWMGVMKRR